MVDKKPTIKEIAKLAQVSPATVSLIINNKKGVSEQTRKRVQSILESQMYVPQRSSSSTSPLTFVFLKYREHGMIVEENQGFIAAILDHIEYICNKEGIQLISKTADASTIEQILASPDVQNADGVFVLGTELHDNQLTYLQKIPCPYLVVDNYCRFHQINSVVMSNVEIVYQAIGHLYALGHRTIGYLSSNTIIANFRDREDGFYSALKELKLQAARRINVTPTLHGAYMDMKAAIAANPNMPSAFFANNDTIALGAIKALQEKGYRIPEDISIIGVDDIPYSKVATPALTTIRISRQTMGKCAVTALLQSVRSSSANSPISPIKVLVNGDLVLRDSTRPVPVETGSEQG